MANRRFEYEKAFLGRGWAFPFEISSGQVEMAVFEEDVYQAILLILSTNRGERLMRPTFGAGLEDFTFEPINATTCEQIRFRVEESLIDWEPRIDLIEVSVRRTGENNRLDIQVHYKVRSTNTEHNLVYPFYLQEGNG